MFITLIICLFGCATNTNTNKPVEPHVKDKTVKIINSNFVLTSEDETITISSLNDILIGAQQTTLTYDEYNLSIRINDGYLEYRFVGDDWHQLLKVAKVNKPGYLYNLYGQKYESALTEDEFFAHLLEFVAKASVNLCTKYYLAHQDQEITIEQLTNNLTYIVLSNNNTLYNCYVSEFGETTCSKDEFLEEMIKQCFDESISSNFYHMLYQKLYPKGSASSDEVENVLISLCELDEEKHVLTFMVEGQTINVLLTNYIDYEELNDYVDTKNSEWLYYEFIGWADENDNLVTKGMPLKEDLILHPVYHPWGYFLVEYYIDGELYGVSRIIENQPFVPLEKRGYLLKWQIDTETIDENYVVKSNLKVYAKAEEDLINGNYVYYFDEDQLLEKRYYYFGEIIEDLLAGQRKAIDEVGNSFFFNVPFTESINIYYLPIKTCADDPEQDICRDPYTWTWKYNRTGFNGKKMTIKILSGSPNEIDPYSPYYTGNRKEERKAQLAEIAKAYNITIKYEAYPNEASWGQKRANWINNLFASQITDQGDIFQISSDWVPILAKERSIAKLEVLTHDLETGAYQQIGGYFTTLKYQQNNEKNKLFQKNNIVYGYSTGGVHADFFLYYNKDLVDYYELEDPAQLWNEGRWDWTTFTNYLDTAQNAFNSNPIDNAEMFAIGGWCASISRGVLSGRGAKLIDPYAKKVLFTSQATIDCIEDLRNIVRAKEWARIVGDVCDGFVRGIQLFQPGEMWFLSSTLRFVDNCDFEVAVVPYPTADGDATTKELFTIPMRSETGWAIRNTENDESGLTTIVLANILDDINRGLKPEVNIENQSEEEIYRTYLKKIITNEASIDAIMSIENNLTKYSYLDYTNIVSQYINYYSDWMVGGYDTWAQSLLNLNNNPAELLASRQKTFQDTLDTLLAD